MEERREDIFREEPAESPELFVDAQEPETGEETAPGGERQEASGGYDYHDAIIQIEMLFQSHILSFGYKEYSLETYADRGFFQRWKAREGCHDTDEMRAGLNIDGILRSGDPSESEVLTYLQYALNIAELCRRSFNGEDARGYDFDIRNYTELLSRIRAILGRLKYDARYVPDREFVYLLPHDAAAEAASTDEMDPLSRDITEYRSTSAVGHLDRKRVLLANMGKHIDAYPDNLSREHAALFGRIQFLLGNLNIREDNISGENRIERVAEMSEPELEHWYDETYQLLLLRILEHQSRERMEAVDALAEECGIGISSISEEEIAALLNERPEETDERSGISGEGENSEKTKTRKDRTGETGSKDRSTGQKEKKETRSAERSGRGPEEAGKEPSSASKTTAPASDAVSGNTRAADTSARKVILAVIIADILFVLFVLCWLFLFHGV